MGTTALRQLLKSLCQRSQWKYALFWKLKHENPMILTWEDGYCSYQKPGESTETISGDSYFNGGCEIVPSDRETSICNGTSEGYPIGLAVADMSCLQYTLGEGIIGEVAFTGNHCWISSDSIFANELDSKLMFEYPNEWLLQFASGIKTVLLVPVLPHGVLQLGSLQRVLEDAAVATHLQDRFNMLQIDIGDASHFTLNRDFQSQLWLPSSSPLSSTNLLSSSQEFEDSNTTDDVKPNKTEQSSPFGLGPVERITGMLELTENDLQVEMVDSKLFNMPCLEDLQAFSQYNVSATSSNKTVEELPYPDMDVGIVDYQNLSSILSFPMDSELHKALGPAFPGQKSEYLWDSFLTVDDINNISDSICNTNRIDGIESSFFPERSNPHHLLEAKIDNVGSCPSSGQFVSSSQPQTQSRAASEEESVPQSHVTVASSFRDRNALTNSSASHSLGSMISTLINDDQRRKSSREMQPRKSAKPSNASKRRVRSGDNPKPRPRDRQLIQDRVKELRELVPDGAKCSIDGLLDKAIKHMMFLRSATDRAQKLKQLVNHEVTEPRKSRETNNGCQNGTSWALEVDSESQVCPIVVEDLEYPGHMLIEMLCDDLGVFLEISQVIRGLELTIIKGTLESHSNNTWAHFIVEASKGFHRMDIFWPLMQFLQRKRNPISSKI